MAKKSTAAKSATIRPAHQAELHFMVSPLTVLPADQLLPQTVAEFITETRILVHAVAFWDAILQADDETCFKDLTDDRDGTDNKKPVDHGVELAEYVVHALGLLVERLRAVFSKFENRIRPYDSIRKMAGEAGSSYCEVALKLGEKRWAWIHQASPRKCSGNSITPALSREELGTWTYCRRMAECAAKELPWLRENLKLPTPDCEELLNLLAVESRRVKPERKSINREIMVLVHQQRTKPEPISYSRIAGIVKQEFGKPMSPECLRVAYNRWLKENILK